MNHTVRLQISEHAILLSIIAYLVDKNRVSDAFHLPAYVVFITRLASCNSVIDAQA